MIPCAVIQAAISGADQIHADPQYCYEGRHRIEAAVEPEYKLIEVGWQMLLADPMMGSHQPSFQIRKCDVDHWQVGIDFCAIAALHHRLVRVPNLVNHRSHPIHRCAPRHLSLRSLTRIR